MLTKAQWDAMTDQQKWDYVHALEDMIEAMELEGEPDVDATTRQTRAMWHEFTGEMLRADPMNFPSMTQDEYDELMDKLRQQRAIPR